MAKKLIDILSDAAVVRDETNEKANTAERVGGVLVELANYLSAFAPVSDVTVETEGDYVRLVLHIKNEDGTVSTRRVTLPAASTSSAGVLTSELLKALNAADRSNEYLAQEGISKAESASAMLFAEEAARKETDAELLKRIIGKSTASSAYNDPFKYLKNYQSEKDENGTITKHAIRVMQDALLDTLRHSDYSESFPYIGHMRAHIEGVPIGMWTYVKAWNTGSTNGVFVQVVRTNFGLKGGVISSALTSEFHEYHRTVTVSMADGSVTDVTATAWKESTVTTEQAKKLNIITYLGHYSTRDALLAAAAKINVVQLSSDNSVRILYGTYTEGSTNSVLILQHNTRTGAVSESGRGTTMQYVFDGKERYTRYIDHNASSVTAVQPLQREGVRNLYFTPKGFIGLRDMWGTQVGSGFFLPDNTAIREDAANTTATSVGLIITSFLGTTKTATLGAVTSARAGLMTVALYNELKQATAGVAAEETARINLGNQIAADIQSIYKRLAAADAELSASISAEEAARTQRDAELTVALTAETNTRLTADSDEKEARETADDELSERITSEAAAREASDAELQAKIQDHEDRIWKLENQWYGIEWDTEVSSPAVTRIGNMDLHRTLPIQSRMRGCLLDDNGKVTKYLNPKDWTGEVRDGSRGQVMVEIPMHYRRCETEGTKRRVKLSEYPLPGFLPIPRMYPSAYEASLQRSTNKLCSVVNTDPDFRGGNNNAAWDGTYRSLLGRPVTDINRTNFRTYARNRNNAATAEWNLYTYHVHKAIYWLYVVEYANRNSQLPFTAELTAEGFHQGGLGAGVSDWLWSDWSIFYGYYPFVPCGHTDTLGNSTGVVAYTALNADGSELKTSNVPRYRGVENPFGHIWKWTDGINVRISPTEANGGDNLSKVFVCEDPAKFNDSNYEGYSHVGNEARTNGYVKEVVFGEGGEIMPSLVGGGSTQFFCDNHWTNIPTTETLRGVLLSAAAHNGASGGLAAASSDNAPSYSLANIGSRLCFIPSE